MPSVTPLKQWPRGPKNELHKAAYLGSTERTVALLSDGSIDIDQGDPRGWTPLTIASRMDRSRVVRILLSEGANVAIVDDIGASALHDGSAQLGHLAVSKMLVEAGADLDATTYQQGYTPLFLATDRNHSEVMSTLVEAGANPNRRASDGRTPLFIAAKTGSVDAVKVLLRVNADPLMACGGLLPLEQAAQKGHSEVVRELLQHVGIKGCGGESEGLKAFFCALMTQRLDIMTMFISAGVDEHGDALLLATEVGKEASVKFLLQHQGWKASGERFSLNTGNPRGHTPLDRAIARYPSPRIVRLLVDAGADTARRAVRLTDDWGRVEFNGTPIALTTSTLRAKKVDGKDATEEQLYKLEGIRRLLSRVEAVYAVS